MTYKKRARNGWNTGKHCKRNSNNRERTYAKEEIKNELEEVIEGEDFRYRHRRSRKRTWLQRLERILAWYDRYIEKLDSNPPIFSYHGSDYYRKKRNELLKKIKELKERNGRS